MNFDGSCDDDDHVPKTKTATATPIASTIRRWVQGEELTLRLPRLPQGLDHSQASDVEDNPQNMSAWCNYRVPAKGRAKAVRDHALDSGYHEMGSFVSEDVSILPEDGRFEDADITRPMRSPGSYVLNCYAKSFMPRIPQLAENSSKKIHTIETVSFSRPQTTLKADETVSEEIKLVDRLRPMSLPSLNYTHEIVSFPRRKPDDGNCKPATSDDNAKVANKATDQLQSTDLLPEDIDDCMDEEDFTFSSSSDEGRNDDCSEELRMARDWHRRYVEPLEFKQNASKPTYTNGCKLSDFMITRVKSKRGVKTTSSSMGVSPTASAVTSEQNLDEIKKLPNGVKAELKLTDYDNIDEEKKGLNDFKNIAASLLGVLTKTEEGALKDSASSDSAALCAKESNNNENENIVTIEGFSLDVSADALRSYLEDFGEIENIAFHVDPGTPSIKTAIVKCDCREWIVSVLNGVPSPLGDETNVLIASSKNYSEP